MFFNIYEYPGIYCLFCFQFHRTFLRVAVDTSGLRAGGSSRAVHEIVVPRGGFEAAAASYSGDLFARMIVPVAAALRAAELSPSDVDEVLLIGASTRMPRIPAELVRRRSHMLIYRY